MVLAAGDSAQRTCCCSPSGNGITTLAERWRVRSLLYGAPDRTDFVYQILDSDDIRHFDYQLDETNHFVQRRFAISGTAQSAERILNTVFWLENPPLRDPGHRNGVLSLVILL